ncbi:MAG TPA: single-stranded-DNA-specific exonuclease RecJ [Phycisphaerales bacterium]|nr:single-stranded-DNA-specific exonuclease RecJ [Phycisphaerales bacterium]
MTHRWAMAPDCSANGPPPDGAGLETLGFEPVVARFLRSRGFGAADAAEGFARPRLTDLHSPTLLPDCDRAAERLLRALHGGEPIVVYADYDADGLCAGAILYHVLSALAPRGARTGVTVYVPHRVDEGYGLHEEAIRALATQGAKVVVSVDCGITAHGPARVAKEIGIDLIITDHHNPTDANDAPPDAYAVVHPRRNGTAYPFGELCGAGVAFKLAWRLVTMREGSDKVSEPMRALLLDLLALAAVGTVADIVPLVGENRIIARYGLRRVKSTALAGLATLVSASGLAGEEITSEHAGFALAPRLNACGRLDSARDAVELLTTAAGERAVEIAKRLTKLNDERRRTEAAIFEHAVRLAEEQGMTRDDRRAIVLAHADWHPGVVGIVCSRLVGKYHRPTILLNEKDGACHGSGRSIDGFNLHGAISRCAPMLTKFGGHDMAAGLALEKDKLDEFVSAFTEHANSVLTSEHLTPELRVDCDASVDELTAEAVKQLSELGPFGRGNPQPRILLRGVTLARDAQPFGAGGAHASVFVKQGSREMRLVGWRWGERRRELLGGRPIDAVVEPKLNHWQGRVKVEPELRDARLIDAGAM